MMPLKILDARIISRSAITALSIFVIVFVLFVLAVTFNWLCRRRRRSYSSFVPKNASWYPHVRRVSYETFDHPSSTISIDRGSMPHLFLDEQFIQPPSECNSNALSPIREVQTNRLSVPQALLRRHSAPKSIKAPSVLLAPQPTLGCMGSCMQLRQQQEPTLRLSISFVHTLELLRVVVDRVSGLQADSAALYALRLRVMPRSQTSAYLSRPLVTRAVLGCLEFDHLFEYTVSLQRLEQARIEICLFVCHSVTEEAVLGRRRHTVGEVARTARGGSSCRDVKLIDLLSDYQRLGNAEIVLDTHLLKGKPEAFANMSLALKGQSNQDADP